ncbi:hypothetical protein GGR42_000180 [Saonia flava]|uniref:Coiled-coil domain-containing protein 167 n=1 Tax=Saonia flava TaxID=523696 RepID=A0A846QNL5_9FLAO|nr:hypothetical protein [Saonia flava]NJB69718.1 hypothetical protein [Saonia flava]
MGGEGSMSHAITSLRENRALLRKRRTFKEIREYYANLSGKTRLDFKNVSPEELLIIRNKIIEKAKKDKKKEILISIVALGLVSLFIYLVYWWFTV